MNTWRVWLQTVSERSAFWDTMTFLLHYSNDPKKPEFGTIGIFFRIKEAELRL